MKTTRVFSYDLFSEPSQQVLLDTLIRDLKTHFITLVTLNPEMIVKALRSDFLKSFYHQATYRVADGIGLTLAARLVYGKDIPRITGIGFIETLFDSNLSFYLIGSTEAVIQKAVSNLKAAHPNMTLLGSHHGYLTPDLMTEQLDHISSLSPDVILVGMGAPHQERFIHFLQDRLSKGLAIGVGGSFDVLAGATPRAPKWSQKLGLEWLFRILYQPERLQRLTFVGPFLWLCFKGLLLRPFRR